MKTSKNKIAKVRIYVDLFFFILMILVLIPQSTGIPIHEWGSFIILFPFFLHLMINWKWIIKNSSKILKKESNKTRFDYIFNWILYLFMLVVTVSGIVISESVLPLFGVYF
jgi:cytochrome b561